MTEKNNELKQLELDLDLIPEQGELEEKLRDKQIFGVYDDEDGADRAIRQLNKLGYDGEHIFVYSKDEEKARRITEESQKDVNIRYEYSPESFSGTEMDNAVLICEKVMEALDINENNKIILNLPATVEGRLRIILLFS